MPMLYFDTETGGPRSLHESGAWAYAACPDTEPIATSGTGSSTSPACCAYSGRPYVFGGTSGLRRVSVSPH